MTTTLERSPRATKSKWGFGIGLLLLFGWALFAHGCHGDEDNELFSDRRIGNARGTRFILSSELAERICISVIVLPWYSQGYRLRLSKSNMVYRMDRE
jgi:hypothetical protein